MSLQTAAAKGSAKGSNIRAHHRRCVVCLEDFESEVDESCPSSHNSARSASIGGVSANASYPPRPSRNEKRESLARVGGGGGGVDFGVPIDSPPSQSSSSTSPSLIYATECPTHYGSESSPSSQSSTNIPSAQPSSNRFLSQSNHQSTNEGVFCRNGHFICINDFVLYISDASTSQIYKLRENGGSVRCPQEGCSCYYEPLFLHHTMKNKNRFSSVVCDLFASNIHVDSIRKLVLDLMVLSCPSCRGSVDPHPDACSAVMCLNCGNHYCNYCFQGFSSNHTETNRNEAHLHVGTHNESNRDPFLPIALVDRGHALYRASRLSDYLIHSISSCDLTNSVDKSTLMRHTMLALISCSKDLEDLSIDVWGLWMSKVVSADLSSPDVVEYDLTNPYIRPYSLYKYAEISTESSSQDTPSGDTSLTTDTEPFKPKKFGGRQMANAILTDNSDAFFQIAHAYRDVLDVDYIEETQGSPIAFLSLSLSQRAVFKYLVDAGADLSAQTRSGRTALYLAIETGDLDTIEFIISKIPDFDVNAEVTSETARYRPIHIVAFNNHGNLIHYFKRLGADLNMKDREYGYTPLMLALLLSHQWVAHELILLGADVLAALETSGRTAFYIAAEKGLVTLLELMIEMSGFDVNAPVEASTGLRLIHVATINKQTAVVNYLISIGADLNIKNSDLSHLSICNAIFSEDTEAALSLIDAGVDVDSVSVSGRYPIFIAIERGFVQITRALALKSKRSINDYCEIHKELRPIHVATLFNQSVMLPLLIDELGADINVDDMDGNTPLHIAAFLKNPWAVERLLKAGAEVNRVNQQGMSALYIALKADDSCIVKLLITIGKVDINKSVINGHLYRPIHVAAFFDHVFLFLLLLRLGADVDSKDAEGRTAYDVALTKGSVKCLSILKERKKDRQDEREDEEEKEKNDGKGAGKE